MTYEERIEHVARYIFGNQKLLGGMREARWRARANIKAFLGDDEAYVIDDVPGIKPSNAMWVYPSKDERERNPVAGPIGVLVSLSDGDSC